MKKLVAVQEQLKALHETRHAGFLAEAAAAAQEAVELAARFDGATSLGDLFPDLYCRRIAQAHMREAEKRELARVEAERVATATARANMVERSYRHEHRKEERASGDRDRLEMIAQLRAHKTAEQ